MNVEFGKYPQGARGRVLPIEWIVLDKQKDKKLLISKYALDDKPFHDKEARVTWASSFIRKWLNSEFLNTAFNKKEQQLILDTKHQVITNKEYYDDDQGPIAIDKVFFLDYEEAEKYFEYRVDRICKPTPYIKKGKFKNGSCYWQLSTVSEFGESTANGFVSDDGFVVASGIFDVTRFFTHINSVTNTNTYHLIRPAMWIKDK